MGRVVSFYRLQRITILKNLDLINPKFAKPKYLCANGSIVPLVLSLCSIALIDGAAVDANISNNPAGILFIIFAFVNIVMLFAPRLLNWDWKIKYFFVNSLQMGCVALLGAVPWLCFLLYANASWALKIPLTLAYLGLITSGCRQFLSMYSKVKNSPALVEYLYQQDGHLAYYMQKHDMFLIEKIFKLSFFPPAKYFIFFSILAFGSIPFASYITSSISLPFAHMFLGLIAIPIDIMALAFLTRGWMVLVHLPKQILPKNSEVYVDMATKTSPPSSTALANKPTYHCNPQR